LGRRLLSLFKKDGKHTGNGEIAELKPGWLLLYPCHLAPPNMATSAGERTGVDFATLGPFPA